jgi:hypothetical protein
VTTLKKGSIKLVETNEVVKELDKKLTEQKPILKQKRDEAEVNQFLNKRPNPKF